MIAPGRGTGWLTLDASALLASAGLAALMVLAPISTGMAQDATSPDPGTVHLHPERFELEDGSYATAQRGVLYVPQDRSRSRGGTLGLVFHRFAADDSVSAERPPIFRLHAGRLEQLAPRARPGDGDDWTRIPNAAFWLLDCGSGITGERARALLDDPAREVVGATAWLYFEGCPVWDVDLGDDFRTGFRTRVPTVVVHGNWDLSTPYENALEMMPAFENGTLVTVDRGTHGALEEAMEASDSFREQVLRFLRTGETSGLPEQVQLPPVDWRVPSDLPAAGG